MPGAPDPLYVKAREVLLDALEALAPHRSSLVLVGAQAIYLHTGEADVAVAPYTTDADLVIDPRASRGDRWWARASRPRASCSVISRGSGSRKASAST